MNRVAFCQIFLLTWIPLFLLQEGCFVMASPVPIVQLGDPILHDNARALSMDEIHSPYIQSIIQTMHDTVHGTGVGLAAPQIGYSLQIVVIEDLPEYIDRLPLEVREERGRKAIPFHVLINPKIIWMDQEKALFFEGCLSISNSARIVPRAKHLSVEFLDEKGERHEVIAEGWYARILQHEIGHLHGTLFIDVSDPHTAVTMEEYKTKWLYARATDIKQFYDEQLKKENTDYQGTEW